MLYKNTNNIHTLPTLRANYNSDIFERLRELDNRKSVPSSHHLVSETQNSEAINANGKQESEHTARDIRSGAVVQDSCVVEQELAPHADAV